MIKNIRNIDEKKLFEEIVRLFTNNKVLREYCGITDLEASTCEKVFIEDKFYNELAIPNKIKRSQVKEMAAAPFLKVINRILKQISANQQLNKIKEYYDNDIEKQEHKMMKDEPVSVTIDNFTISERTKKILKENGITSINEITELDFNDLKLTGNYGVKTIFELKQLAGKLKDSRDILSTLRKSGK